MSTAVPPLAAVNAAFSVLNLGMHLLAAHDQRVQVAKTENLAVQQAYATMLNDLDTIFDAANLGYMTNEAAADACADVSQWYWQYLNPLIQGPTKGPTVAFPNPNLGASPNSAAVGGIYYEASDGGNCHCAGEKINGVTGCTAGCCIGCAAVDPTLSNAYVGFKTGKAFTMQSAVVIPDPTFWPKTGPQGFQPKTFTFTPPKALNLEEVTVSKTTGVVTVGAPPSGTDTVVQTGKASSTATPDQGGIVPVTQTNETLTGPSQTNGGVTTPTGTGTGQTPTLTSLVSSLGPYGWYIVGAVALLLLILLTRSGASTSQPQVIVLPEGSTQ
jgi:hypothetical protein